MPARLALPLAGCLLLASCSDPLAEAEVAYREGAYEEARALYAESIEGGSRPEALKRARLGLTLRKLGRHADALAELERAVAVAEAAGDGHLGAVARRYLGRTLVELGRVDEAMERYDEALRWHLRRGPESDLLSVQIQRAGAAWALGDWEKAHAAYEDAEGRAAVLADRGLQADALSGMAMLYGFVGDFATAAGLEERALRLNRALGRPGAVAGGLLNAAVTAQAELRVGRAERLAREAFAAPGASAVVRGYALVTRAHALVEGGRLGEALAAAEVAAQQAEVSGLRPLADAAALARGRALVELGRGAEARPLLEQVDAAEDPHDRALARGLRVALTPASERLDAAREAVRAFEAVREAVGARTLDRFFSEERARAYEALMGLAVDAGQTDEALGAVAAVKARALAETLLATEPGGERRRRQRAANLLGVGSVSGLPSAAEVSAALPPGWLALEYYALPERLLVFVLTREARRVRVVPVGREDLGAAADALRGALVGGAEAWRERAAWLARRLLDPAAEQLRALPVGGALAVAPHAGLHAVPFEVLPWAGGRLVDRRPVFGVPNLAALHRGLSAPPRGRPERVLVVGDPRGDLPGARHEAEAVAGRFPAVSRLLGADATERAVRSAGPGAALLHLAVHGIRGAGGAPAHLELLEDSEHDGRLYADEIARLGLDARLVVLSVCDSARGRANRGDEVAGVLDRAFLAGGAQTVVASRWPVHDAASVLFMRHFYAELERGSAVEALRAAQLALRTGRLGPADLGADLLARLGSPRVEAFRGVRAAARPLDFRQPYFWAAFTLVGSPR